MQDIPHALSDGDFRELAGRSHGYVGADLAAVCREAGLKCINRCAKENTQGEHAVAHTEREIYCYDHNLMQSVC